MKTKQEQYAVMIECRTGTIRPIFDGYEHVYHVITFQVEDTYDQAVDVALRLTLGREIKRIWIDEVGQRDFKT